MSGAVSVLWQNRGARFTWGVPSPDGKWLALLGVDSGEQRLDALGLLNATSGDQLSSDPRTPASRRATPPIQLRISTWASRAPLHLTQ